MFSGSVDGRLHLYDIMKSEPVATVQVSSGVISGLDVHEEGGLVAGCHDGSIFYWKL